MNFPEYAEVNGKKYKINTDFRVALKCNEIAEDTTIGDYERALAIIYLLFGDEGLNDSTQYNDLLKMATKYLSCGKEIEQQSEEDKDMDFEQDMELIRMSLLYDYNVDISTQNMHWWDFYEHINGLSEKCVLNRVRELRTYDTSQIKDAKERSKIEKSKKQFELKKKEKPLTEKEQRGLDLFKQLTSKQ